MKPNVQISCQNAVITSQKTMFPLQIVCVENALSPDWYRIPISQFLHAFKFYR